MKKYGVSNFLPFMVLAIALALRMASAGTASFSFLVLAGYALQGRTQAIQALALSWLFTMLNPALVPEASAATIGRYLVIAAAAISVAWRSAGHSAGLLGQRLRHLTLLLGIFFLVHSLMYSAVVDVSILKAISWVVVVLTLMSAWQGLAPVQHSALFNQLHWGLIGLLLLSLPVLAISNIGFLRNGTGFQGMLNHPQAFGPTVALAGALIGGRVLGEYRPHWRDLALFVLCIVFVLLSEARTAGFAMILGLFASVVLSPMFAGVPRLQMLPGLRSRRLQVLALLSVCGIILFGSFFAERLTSFLFKRTAETSLIAAADASRGALVEKMILNILENPLTGIGFGIASNPADMEVERDPIFNLPLGAPVEKGVMPIAIVEELGIFGAVLVFGWMLFLLRSSSRVGVPQFAVLITLLLVNFGESMIFSVGGMGMLLLILLTGAATGVRRAIGVTYHA